MVTVTLLGTSAMIPLPERAETAAVLTCRGRSILFDCGEGTQTAARKAGVSLFKTDVIALTHYHGDHIFGLPGLLQSLNIMGRTETLYITGPGCIEKELKHILALAGQTAYAVKLLPVPGDGLSLHALHRAWPEGAGLTGFETAHRAVSRGYAFTLPRAGKFLPEKAKALGIPVNAWHSLQNGETVRIGENAFTPEMVLGEARKGLKIVFSGDTAACASLENAAAGADLMLCEATYGENEQEPLAAEHGHMTFAQAGRLAANAGTERLWLMHYSQMIEDPAVYLPNAQAYFPGTECGYDGKTVTLHFSDQGE